MLKAFIAKMSNKKIALWIGTVLLAVSVILIYLAKGHLFENWLLEHGIDPYFLIIGGIGFVGLIFILYYYLEEGSVSFDFSSGMIPTIKFKSSKTSNYAPDTDPEVVIEGHIKGQLEAKLLERETELAAIINKKIDEILNQELFNSQENKDSKSNEIDTVKLKSVFDDFYKFKLKLTNQIDRLKKNNSLNLAIGSASTLAAIIVIWQLVLKNNSSELFTEIKPALIYYIPRITFAIFIEFFAFFFLRIYRKNLDDIKYFQNERTNIDAKLLALKSAFWTKDIDIIKQVIIELAKTERNFIIKKDETTIGLKTLEIESEQEKKMYDLISTFFNKNKVAN